MADSRPLGSEERQLQRDLLEELLAENESQTGPISLEMHDRAAQAFRAAEALAQHDPEDRNAAAEESAGDGETGRDRRAG